jgi:hypothetical protein
MRMNAFPQDRRGWMRLVALPFEVYVLTVYWITGLYLHLIPDRAYSGNWIAWTILGYVCCFWLLVMLGGVQCLIGARKDAQVTWGIASATPLLLILMFPWLAS